MLLVPTPTTSAICCRVAPFSSIRRQRSTTSVVIIRRRPPMRPCSLAAAKPARVRSTISSLSISASALMTWKKKRPAGVLVSMLSVRLRKFTPRACSSDTRVIRSRTLRPSRSSFQTTSTSPGRSRRSARFNPGRLAFFPLAVSSKTSSHSARISAFFCKSRF